MTSEAGPRWVQVGHSTDRDAGPAGTAAARGALRGPDPRLLVVFPSFGYDLAALLAGVAAQAPGVPVIGCSTAGGIGPGPALGTGVVAVGFGGAFDVRTGHATGLRDDPRGTGERVATALLPLPRTGNRVALMLTDALAGDQQEMIRGAYGVVGATVPLIGGGAADDMRMVTSQQFHGTEELQDSVVAASLGSDGPVAIAVRHGWRRYSDAMVVTGSAGNEVHTLDDQPALDVYLQRLHAPPGIDRDPAAFFDFSLTRPLAVCRRGDDAVRHVLGADPRTRTLRCAGGVPKGASAWLMSGDAQSTLDAADGACAEAIGALDGVPLQALLVFDCAGRRAVLGDDGVVAERAVMGKRVGDAALAGFYTYGEIARTRGVNGFHNQTIVAVAFG